MNFIENRKKFYILSLALIFIGLVAMVINAVRGNGMFNYDVEFTGGTVMQIELGQEVDITNDIRPMVVEFLGDNSPRIQMVTGTTEILITTKPTELEQRQALFEAMQEKYQLTTENLLRDNNISPTISPEIRAKAVEAVLLGALLMLIYISIRFKDFTFGTSAVIALLHDVCIMLMAYAVFRVPVNNSFIAAMLTIIGYSINDTIIVFDRIRENKGRMRNNDIEIVNTSINQTLTRSINTSLTTLIMVALLYFLGTSSVKEFAFPLLIGILAGTYSSIFIASPIWYEMKQAIRRRKNAEKAQETSKKK